ncbi:NOL1/NOP2/sun family putative RNA methylase [Candidatus Gracilibacteria bacterium]|nr:NOL1/NOP2/sun family putative RNA methylase [Candidatus Gracilibacteria bacterium]
MKQDFLDYIQETFQFSPSEMTEFSCALTQPLKKTLRVNINKISVSDFKLLALKNNWQLSETPLGNNTFYIDREDTSLALGNTLEHITGYFYIQELAASSSPYYLSDDIVDETEYTILDMSASPGGKTTQLAEYYPNSVIIANEIDKSRMRQLHENTDRLGTKNVFVTNYDGRFFANYEELFDKILLDAPCSGEGTAYKSDDALKYWNIKNIKKIAKLQFQLLESAMISLKVGGELVYSTCTLNRLENEEIINKLTGKYGEHFNVVSLSDDLTKPLIRAWPHKEKTGGFFVVKLRKKTPFPDTTKKRKLQKNIQGFERVSNTDSKIIETFLLHTFGLLLTGKFYTYRNEIYYTEKNIDFFWENFFLFKVGVKIGKLDNGVFEPNFFLGTHFGIFSKNSIKVSDSEIDSLFKGQETEGIIDSISKNISDNNNYYQVYIGDIPAGVIKMKGTVAKSLLESRFMRK